MAVAAASCWEEERQVARLVSGAARSRVATLGLPGRAALPMAAAERGTGGSLACCTREGKGRVLGHGTGVVGPRRGA
jgi:hypothetical protein